MDLPKISGIYRIRNTENNRAYIGSAKDMYVRQGKHLSLLRKGKHHSRHLQAAWSKYGEARFVFEQIEHCATEALIEREQFWLDNASCEYNVAPTAGNTLGIRLTDERKAKISAAHLGKVRQSRRKLYTLAGVTQTLYDIADSTGIPVELLRGRIKQGVPLEEAVAAGLEDPRKAVPARRAKFIENASKSKKGKPTHKSPEGKARQREAVIEYNKSRVLPEDFGAKVSAALRAHPDVERFDVGGTMMTVLDMSERFGVCRHVLRKRINAGWPVEEAINRPVNKKPRKPKNGIHTPGVGGSVPNV